MKKTVLVIEDDREQLKMLKQLVMEINGSTEVYMAENAAQAYQILLEKTIDVFLVDIILEKGKPGDASGTVSGEIASDTKILFYSCDFCYFHGI